MNINDLWNLFKMTGKIEYYLKYKELLNKEVNNIKNEKSKRNNS